MCCNVGSKLFAKKVEKLFEPPSTSDANNGLSENALTLYRSVFMALDGCCVLTVLELLTLLNNETFPTGHRCQYS